MTRVVGIAWGLGMIWGVAFASQPAAELQQLKDIHPPEPIGWWPLAVGWYVLLAIITLLLITMALLVYRIYKRGDPKREALRLLKEYEQQYLKEKNAPLISARISELLKRVALVYYPREQVASLTGEGWIVFLNQTSKGVDFKMVKEELLELPFQKMGRNGNMILLFDETRKWIKQRSKPCLR